MSLYTGDSTDNFLTLVKAENPNLIIDTPDLFIMGTPTDNVGARNSAINIRGIEGNGYVGTQNIKYNRIDLGVLFSGFKPVLNVPRQTSIYNLLPSLNKQLGLNLSTNDVEDAEIVWGEEASVQVVNLVCKPTSLQFMGDVEVDFPWIEFLLQDEVVVLQIPLFRHSDDHVNGKISATLSTWGIDFTSVKDQLRLVKPNLTGVTVPTTARTYFTARQTTLVNTLMNIFGLYGFYEAPLTLLASSYCRWIPTGSSQNFGGSVGVINGPAWYPHDPNMQMSDKLTSEVPEANQNFDRVVVFKLNMLSYANQDTVINPHYYGTAYFHYNV